MKKILNKIVKRMVTVSFPCIIAICVTVIAVSAFTPSSSVTLETPNNLTNVALNANVTLHGESFFTGGWGGVINISEDTIVDGEFLDKNTQWDNGSVWWATSDEVDRNITIDLGDVYRIESFIVQADNNPSYMLYY